MAANHLSDSANNLDPYVKKGYYEKISSVGIGLILIPDKAHDPHYLPRVESLDFRLSFLVLETAGDGQNTDPQSMDYPNGLPKWTTLKWTSSKNTISDEYYIKKLRFYTYTVQIDMHIFVPHGLQSPF